MPIPLGILAVAGAGAAGGGGSFDLLETTVLSSDASSVTFSSLGSYSDYKHLQLRISVTTSSNTNQVEIQFNGATTNYDDHTIYGTGSSVISDSPGDGSAIRLIGPGSYDGGAFNIYGAGIIDILDFSNTNKNTTVRCFGGNDANVDRIALSSGAWFSTSAVTSIALKLSGGNNYREKSRFSLYGVK